MKLGLDAIIPPVTKELKKHSTRIWDCDWIMLNSLSHITPVYDANMWRIYAGEYNKNIEFLTDDELKDICNANKTTIDKFISQNISKRLTDIILRWKDFAEVADESFLGMNIPTASINAFKSFLSFHKNEDIKDDEVSRHHAFAQFHGELQVNMINYGDNESRYLLSIDEFREFMRAIKYEFQNLETRSNVVNSTAHDYKSRLEKSIKYINTLLLVCIGGRSGYEHIHSIGLFEDLIMWRSGTGRISEIIRKTSSMGNLTMAHAVCLYPTSKAQLPLNSMQSSKVTETYRFLTTMMLQAEYLIDLNKTIGRLR